MMASSDLRGGRRMMSSSVGFQPSAVATPGAGDEVDPEQLHGHEALGQAERGGEEDRDDLADVGRDEEADACFVLMYDDAALLVALTMVAKLSSARIMSAAPFATSVPVMPIAMPILAFLSAGASFTPSPVIAQTSPCSCRMRTISCCRGLDAREQVRAAHRAQLRLGGQRHELLADERLAALAEVGLGRVEDADLLADRLGRHLVVARDDDDADARAAARDDRVEHLAARRVEHRREPAEHELALVSEHLGGRAHRVEVAALVVVGEREHAQRLAREVSASSASSVLRTAASSATTEPSPSSARSQRGSSSSGAPFTQSSLPLTSRLMTCGRARTRTCP